MASVPKLDSLQIQTSSRKKLKTLSMHVLMLEADIPV